MTTTTTTTPHNKSRSAADLTDLYMVSGARMKRAREPRIRYTLDTREMRCPTYLEQTYSRAVTPTQALERGAGQIGELHLQSFLSVIATYGYLRPSQSLEEPRSECKIRYTLITLSAQVYSVRTIWGPTLADAFQLPTSYVASRRHDIRQDIRCSRVASPLSRTSPAHAHSHTQSSFPSSSPSSPSSTSSSSSSSPSPSACPSSSDSPRSAGRPVTGHFPPVTSS